MKQILIQRERDLNVERKSLEGDIKNLEAQGVAARRRAQQQR